MVEPFLVSASVVGCAEIGDRTQLLSLALACRYRKPVPVIGGILVATLVSNIVAAIAGVWFGGLLDPSVLKWILVFSFIGMAIWVLIPEKSSVDDTRFSKKRNAFSVTLISFMIAEAGDKTQFATAALAAHFNQILPVIIGSTVGMMVANFPVVLGGHCIGDKVSSSPITRYVAAAIFIAEALITLWGYQLF